MFELDDEPSSQAPRVSLTITVDEGDDWNAVADRAERLGAERLSMNESDGVQWAEMTDPDGNPFRVPAPRSV